MELRVPSGGSFLAALGHEVTEGDGDAIVAAGPDLTPDRLDAELARLHVGEVEYLSLTHGPAALQAAGEGAGPYQIQHVAGVPDDGVVFTDGASFDDVRRAFLAYLVGDQSWVQHHAWQNLDLGARPKRSGGGFLKRIFQKD